MTFTRFALGVTFLAIALVPIAAQSPEADLQRAIQKELASGDLDASIKEYLAIAARAESTNRAVAAQAHLRVANVRSKKGDSQARASYERIVATFPDQPTVIAQAQARLDGAVSPADRARLQVLPTGITSRKVSDGTGGSVSQDGRYVSYVDDQGQLAVRDLVTGASRRLTEGTWDTSYAEDAAISRDGTQVAYTWYDMSKGYQLRIASLAGTGLASSRVLIDNDEVVPSAGDWSPNGRQMVISVRLRDRTSQIALVSVPDGRMTVLTSVDWRGAGHLFFSPDGAYIGYDLPANDTTSNRDVHVLAINGVRQSAVVLQAGHDVMMGWSPDGRHLLFGSDANGGMGLWAVPIEEGRAKGAAIKIKEPIESTFSLGVSSSGTLYLGKGTYGRDIAVAAVDFATGRQTAPPAKPVIAFAGTNRFPDWSRDGKQLAYLSERGNERVIVIRSMDEGRVIRELRPPLRYIQGLSWSPDGRSFVVGGRDLKGRGGNFRIEVDAKDADAMLYLGAGGPPEWSADGRHVYFCAAGGPDANGSVMEYDVAAQTSRVVAQLPRCNTFVAASPDGRWLAAVSTSETLFLIARESGEKRALLSVQDPQSLNYGLGWTRDSRSVIARRSPTALSGDLPKGQSADLLAIPLDGSQPRRLDVNVDAAGPLTSYRVHPDGRRMAFFTVVDPANEIWVVENFLPILARKRAN